MNESVDVVVIGGGAAGLMCALTAGQRGRRVRVLEHANRVGKKILMSGGGRCNFTNTRTRPECFLSENPHFARSALSRYTPADFIALVDKHGIQHYEKTLGQLFGQGAGAAKRIVRMLLDECAAAGVQVQTQCHVREVTRSDRFTIETSRGRYHAQKLVIATGGLSIQKIGATDFAFDIAQQFNIPVINPRPGLVPLTFDADDLQWMRPLSGVSAPAIARFGNARFEEAALFTHRGLSGPVILQISSYWKPGETIDLDLLPGDSTEFLTAYKAAHPKAHIKAALATRLSGRLADALAVHFPAAPLIDQKNVALAEITARLKAWPLRPTGTEGYAKAEVTVGGVDTEALSQKTMETRAVPGLFFIGEAVDVTGWLGGYNFQWAWASAYAAATA